MRGTPISAHKGSLCRRFAESDFSHSSLSFTARPANRLWKGNHSEGTWQVVIKKLKMDVTTSCLSTLLCSSSDEACLGFFLFFSSPVCKAHQCGAFNSINNRHVSIKCIVPLSSFVFAKSYFLLKFLPI